MERQAEHRGAADQRAVLGRQRVDPRHRRGFGRIGQPDDAAGLDRRAQQVAQELRIAAGPLRDDLDHVRRQRMLLRRELRHAQRIALRERLAARSATPAAARRRRTRTSTRPPRDADQPLALGQQRRRGNASSSTDASSMWCASSISMIAAPGIIALEEAPTASCSFARRFSLGEHRRPRAWARRRRRARTAISGSHGTRSGALRGDDRAQALLDGGVGLVAPELQQLAQQLAPHDVRRRRTCTPRRPRGACGSPSRRRASPRAGASCRCPPRRRSRPAGPRRCARRRAPCGSCASSALRPVSGRRCSGDLARARAGRARRPTTPGPARPCP